MPIYNDTLYLGEWWQGRNNNNNNNNNNIKINFFFSIMLDSSNTEQQFAGLQQTAGQQHKNVPCSC
jgi:hypothetical protein